MPTLAEVVTARGGGDLQPSMSARSFPMSSARSGASSSPMSTSRSGPSPTTGSGYFRAAPGSPMEEGGLGAGMGVYGFRGSRAVNFDFEKHYKRVYKEAQRLSKLSTFNDKTQKCSPKGKFSRLGGYVSSSTPAAMNRDVYDERLWTLLANFHANIDAGICGSMVGFFAANFAVEKKTKILDKLEEFHAKVLTEGDGMRSEEAMELAKKRFGRMRQIWSGEVPVDSQTKQSNTASLIDNLLTGRAAPAGALTTAQPHPAQPFTLSHQQHSPSSGHVVPQTPPPQSQFQPFGSQGTGTPDSGSRALFPPTLVASPPPQQPQEHTLPVSGSPRAVQLPPFVSTNNSSGHGSNAGQDNHNDTTMHVHINNGDTSQHQNGATHAADGAASA